MNTKFSVRVTDPKSFARAFKLAASTAWKAARHRYGTSRICDNVLLHVSGFWAVLLATDLCQYLTIDLGLTDCQLTLDGDGALFLPQDWKVPREPFALVFEPTDTASASLGQAKPAPVVKEDANTSTTTAVSPIRAKTEHTHEFQGEPSEAFNAKLDANQESPESLGLILNGT